MLDEIYCGTDERNAVKSTTNAVAFITHSFFSLSKIYKKSCKRSLASLTLFFGTNILADTLPYMDVKFWVIRKKVENDLTR